MRMLMYMCISGLVGCAIFEAVCPSTFVHKLIVFDAKAMKRIVSYALEDFTDWWGDDGPGAKFHEILDAIQEGDLLSIFIMPFWNQFVQYRSIPQKIARYLILAVIVWALNSLNWEGKVVAVIAYLLWQNLTIF